jgi:predicted nucleic acid-binding Zn ribbon protein
MAADGTRSAGDPVPLHDTLDDYVRSLRVDGPSARTMGSLFNRWVDAVGQAVADHARPVKLDGERLLVEVDEPAWATQLRFLEADILDRLRSVAGLQVSRFDMRVKPA